MSRDKQADDLNKHAAAAKSLVASLTSEDGELVADMVEGETGLFEAIDAAIAEIDEQDLIVQGCKAKEGQLAKRRARAEARIERLRSLIEQAMLVSGVLSIRRPVATLSVRELDPTPIIADEAAIPAAYWKNPQPVLDRSKINSAIKGGEDIPGVTLSNGTTSLQVRRA